MLKRLLRTLSWKVSEVRKEWALQNQARLKYELGYFTRLFFSACERPVVWTLIPFIVSLVLCLAIFVWSPPYIGLIDWMPDVAGDGNRWNFVDPFIGLWAVQAALVAIVYPIVVAFVTVLLQRQNASKASLHAYFSRSAAKLTGLSSLALVLLMALQFIVLDAVGPMVVFAWIIGDSIWAAINFFLCIVFLHSTFEFASPEGRANERFEYVLTQAWPSEWEYHVKRHISRDPIKHGLLKAIRAVDDLEGAEPALSNPGNGLAKEHATYFHFRRERSVVDIRYLLIQIVYELWSWKNRGKRSSHSKAPGWARVGPVFEISMAYGDRFAFNEPVVETSESATLGPLERGMFRFAISLSRRRIEPRVLVRDALEELKTDAAHAIQADAQAEFEQHLQNLMEMLDAVVEASAYEEQGRPDNWVLLIDSGHAWRSQELIWTWLLVLRDLHGVAIKALAVRDVYATSTVRLSARLLLRQGKSLTDKLRQIYVQHQYLLLYDLLGWGAEGCAASTFADGQAGKLLDEPLRRRYDRVLRDGLGQWESMKNYRLFPRAREESPNWEDIASAVDVLGSHLRFNAQLVVNAMRSDDRVAFEYFTDSLMKWSDQRDRSFTDSGVDYGDRYRVTVSVFSMPISTFRARFPLPVHESEGHESIRAVRTLALKNFWRDVVLTLTASVLNQANSAAISKELAARLVQHMIDGQLILEDGQLLWNPRPFDSADKVLAALFRQLVEGESQGDRYKDRIDKVAESVGISAIAKGISERIYSSSGSDIDYILDAQLIILARMCPKNWEPASNFDNTMRSLATEDNLRRLMLDQLGLWITRLSGEDIARRFSWVWQFAPLEKDVMLEEYLSRTKDGLQRLRDRLGDLREQQLREAEISHLAKKRLADAAKALLSHELSWCPLSLLKKKIITEVSVPGAKSVSLQIRGYDKGAMTDPLMAQIVSNEEEWIRRVTENALANEVLKEALERVGTTDTDAFSIKVWMSELRAWAKKCKDESLSPIAVIPSRVDPPWLLDLIRDRVGETDEAAIIRKRSDFENSQGYIGHFDEVAIYIGPSPRDITVLMTSEEFETLHLEAINGEPFTVDVTPDPSGLKCTITISWKQRLDGNKSFVVRLHHYPQADLMTTR